MYYIEDNDKPINLLNKINGTIINRSEIINNEEFISVEWQGGDRIAITGDLLYTLTDPEKVITNGRMKNGVRCFKIRNLLVIGNFKLRIIHYYKSINTYIAKRIN